MLSCTGVVPQHQAPQRMASFIVVEPGWQRRFPPSFTLLSLHGCVQSLRLLGCRCHAARMRQLAAEIGIQCVGWAATQTCTGNNAGHSRIRIHALDASRHGQEVGRWRPLVVTQCSEWLWGICCEDVVMDRPLTWQYRPLSLKPLETMTRRGQRDSA